MKGSDEKNKNFLRKHTNGRNDKKVQDDENALNKDFNLMGKKVDKTSKNKASKDIKTAKAPQKPINYIKSTIKDAEQTTETTRKTKQYGKCKILPRRCARGESPERRIRLA